MKVVQEQKGRAVAFGQGGQGAERGQRVAPGALRVGATAVAGQTQAAGDVPDGDLPAALAALLDDVAFGLVGLVGLHPQPGEGGVDVVGQLVDQQPGRCTIRPVASPLKWWPVPCTGAARPSRWQAAATAAGSVTRVWMVTV